MPIGYSDLKNVLKISGNWDLSYMKKFSMKDGTTWDVVLRRIGTALTLFNRSLTGGYWGQFMQTTTDMSLEYDTGGESAGLSKVSEYGRPDPVYGDFTGHMIPMDDYGGALGWTYLALRRGSLSRIDRDIYRLISRARNTWDKTILTRMFKSTYDAVGTGKSMPFADGGTADSTFIPPSYNGQVFASSHNHFLRETDDAAGRTASLKSMGYHLKEHGIDGPWDLIIPEADRALWTAQAEFKKPERGILSTAGVETRASIPEETYLGVLETDDGWFRVKATPRLPVNYAGAFKPAGFNNPAAPLAIRYEEGFPIGLALVGKIEEFPLQDAIAYFTFGVGVTNRIAGTAVYYNAAGSYTDPTIS